jgi:hypothetical protein
MILDIFGTNFEEILLTGQKGFNNNENIKFEADYETQRKNIEDFLISKKLIRNDLIAKIRNLQDRINDRQLEKEASTIPLLHKTEKDERATQNKKKNNKNNQGLLMKLILEKSKPEKVERKKSEIDLIFRERAMLINRLDDIDIEIKDKAEELEKVKNILLTHYHKILTEATDTR